MNIRALSRLKVTTGIAALVIAASAGLSGPAAQPIDAASPHAGCLDPSHGNTVSTWKWSTSTGSRGEMTVWKFNGPDNSVDSVYIRDLLGRHFSGTVRGTGRSATILAYAGPTGSDPFLLATFNPRSNRISGTVFGLPQVGHASLGAVGVSCSDNPL